jgi:hypothetical protein
MVVSDFDLDLIMLKEDPCFSGRKINLVEYIFVTDQKIFSLRNRGVQ